MAEVKNITELPLDILLTIFPYLDAKSFLSFCSTCKAFQQPSIRLDPAYWSLQTRSTFRVPNQPTVQHDGDRWLKLYKRLSTQSRVYTWGSGGHSRLGHQNRAQLSSLPKELWNAHELGIVADLQCGGWSTTILNAKGYLHSVGTLDGEREFTGTAQAQRLKFPLGYPDCDEPTTAIRQFSSGRSHVLGLSDSGRIWSWYHISQPATQIKFLNTELKENYTGSSKLSSGSTYGTVKQVVAGWGNSSAYVCGLGIVIWSPVRAAFRADPRQLRMRRPRPHQEEEAPPDTMLLLEYFEMYKTGYQRPRGETRESMSDHDLGEEVGQVQNYILLEHFVVFVTDIGKVFCSKFDEKGKADDILELRAFKYQRGASLDVHGSFQRFAILGDGEVIIAEQRYLDACWDDRLNNPEQENISGLKRVPALQNNDVVQIAFGDFHFVALHSTGKITSYGMELQSRGALGLGGIPTARFRGVSHAGPNSELLPHCYIKGRQVWFRDEQQEWLRRLSEISGDDDEAKDRIEVFWNDRNVAGEVSEWIEQEGKAWDEDSGEDGLGAYFALRVSAAGWHSGAVLLVNEELANKASTYDWRTKRFPRLELSSGEMPGSAPLEVWREGRPEWQLDWEHA